MSTRWVRRSPALVTLVALAVLLLPDCAGKDGSHESGPCAAAKSTGRLAPESEPGTPLVIRGQVFRSDGVTPAAGVILYAYQTDATGVYNQNRSSDDPPRLRIWLRTDAEGRYEYRTIRPASYPGSRNPAHIHVQIWGGGVPAQYVPELWFEDDPYLSVAQREESKDAGRFAWIVKPASEGGVLRATHDIRLGTEGHRFESNTQHGYADCR